MRNLTRRECEIMTRTRRSLSLPGTRGGRTLRFVNYYGEQRFGSARHGGGFAARRLIEGNFEEALKLIIAVPHRKDSRERKAVKKEIAAGWGGWRDLRDRLPPCPEREAVERLAKTGGDFRAGFSSLPHFIKQIVIEAYQSHLWNEIARRLIVRECAPPLIRAPGPFGDLLFPRPSGAPPEIASADIPLLAPRTVLREPWRTAAEEVLSEEGIQARDLRVPGLRIPYFGEVARPLFADAIEFSLGPLEADESAGDTGRLKRRARFSLPRGAYATVLLAALSREPQSILR
jgi:tRNA pseudouridine13 synthase